ncbi:MAG TPA: hypothetical protein VHG08_05785 [Longimicrobium sp.]|nr:hypothetical protein [Longimicrobium sp.]
METLASRAVYDDDELGMTKRLPVVSGVLFGVGMGVFLLYDALADGGSPAAIAGALFWAVASGAGYGLLFPWFLGRAARRVNDQLYASDPRLVPPPEPDRYLYRLPCGWVRTPSQVVGGVLYLGPGGLRFDPHLRTPARLRESLVMEPLQEIQLELVHTPLPRWLRVWGRRTLPRIQLRWGGGEALFGVPDATSVFTRLQDRVTALKQHSPPHRA